MKKYLPLVVFVLLTLMGCGPKEPVSAVKNGLDVFGPNETAGALTFASLVHVANVEYDKGYILAEQAVKADSTAFVAHTIVALFSDGEKKAHHKKLAKKFSEKSNETNKLFVSLLDIEKDEDGSKSKAIWKKMHELSNGPFIHLMYTQNLRAKEELPGRIEELDKLIKFCQENNYPGFEAGALNQKAYVLKSMGDMNGGLAAIERTLELYDGHNPLDSRAEFYLFAGDTVNAIATYEKVLERYPFSQNARESLRELRPKKETVVESN